MYVFDKNMCLDVIDIYIYQIDERNNAIANDYRSICDIFPSFADIATLDDFKVILWFIFRVSVDMLLSLFSVHCAVGSDVCMQSQLRHYCGWN